MKTYALSKFKSHENLHQRSSWGVSV